MWGVRVPVNRPQDEGSQSFHSCVPVENFNRRGLMLFLLLGGDASLNPGPFTLGVLNVRSIRNKGPLLADMVASNDFDFLCLTETHLRPFYSDSFLQSITPPDFIFYHNPCPSGIGGGIVFFH